MEQEQEQEQRAHRIREVCEVRRTLAALGALTDAMTPEQVTRVADATNRYVRDGTPACLNVTFELSESAAKAQARAREREHEHAKDAHRRRLTAVVRWRRVQLQLRGGRCGVTQGEPP
jgi:hypothetical protein